MAPSRRRILQGFVQPILIVFTVWSVTDMFLHSGSGNMQVRSYTVFRYFTIDSNLLCAVSCVFSLLCLPRERTARIRKASMLLRYASTAAVTVTMMTVLLFLGFVYGYGAMFAGWSLWLHLIGPLLSILSFVLLESDGPDPERKHLIFAVLPVIVYGAVYLVMAVFIGSEKGGWPDFYAFNTGGRWYLSYLGMAAGTALIGVLLRGLRKLCWKEK